VRVASLGKQQQLLAAAAVERGDRGALPAHSSFFVQLLLLSSVPDVFLLDLTFKKGPPRPPRVHRGHREELLQSLNTPRFQLP
jgi:hypothetical protein